MRLISDQIVAVIAGNGVNHSELAIAREQLEKSSVTVKILSPILPEVKTWTGKDWGNRIKIDGRVKDEDPRRFDGVIIPGGRFHSDALRMDAEIITFVQTLNEAAKPIGAIGHGMQILINTNIIDGMRVTGPLSIQRDIELAGGILTHENVTRDSTLITCQSEEYAPAFIKVFLEMLSEGIRHRPLTMI